MFIFIVTHNFPPIECIITMLKSFTTFFALTFAIVDATVTQKTQIPHQTPSLRNITLLRYNSFKYREDVCMKLKTIIGY